LQVINLIILIDTYNIGRGGGKLLDLQFTHGLTEMAYGRYSDSQLASKSAIKMFEQQYEQEMSRRTEIYQFIRAILEPYNACDHLESKDVVPYAIPLSLNPNKVESAVKNLRRKGFETGMYYFDMNRFAPEPDFQKTMLIPCHSGLTDMDLENMLDTIIGELK